ncbi:nickel-binding protein [Mangrovibacterium lignilyticum]|uniref:nickel-binding protein n=1 Tax=Mangrovibacterium lignilyticum TaxID=2668052 RepID=UPI0013D8362D|nr:nickel-binding protein [Mangrovibacterium lignilyticum]
MDRHDVSAQVTAEVVAQLHQQDLKLQHLFGCRGLTYWFDDKRKTAFCLIEAPDKEAIKKMHDEAHGEVPHQIIEVSPDIVESFLGRIEDPEKKTDSDLNIIDDSAFRVIMVTGFDECLLSKSSAKKEDADLNCCMDLLSETLTRYEGQVVKQYEQQLMAVFESVSQAIFCAIELHSNYRNWSTKTHCKKFNLKTGISAGVPVTEDKSFFEEAVHSAEQMFFLSDTRIIVSSEINELYRSENRNLALSRDLFVVLTPADEEFLADVMNFLEETWQYPNLHVDDFGKNLGFSKSQVYRKMVSLIGMSPNSFLKNYRLNKAVSLLKKQSKSIAEVAYDSGFNSPSYFTKCFHNKYGVLPSEYIQSSI